MRIIYKVALLLWITLVLLLSGCLGQSSLAGKWISDAQPGKEITLYSDGSFFYHDPGPMGYDNTGTYKVQKSELIMTGQVGTVYYFKIQSGLLIDRNNHTWHKNG